MAELCALLSHSSCCCLIETSRNDILCVRSLIVFEVLLPASKSHHKQKYLLAKASLFPPNIRIFGTCHPELLKSHQRGTTVNIAVVVISQLHVHCDSLKIVKLVNKTQTSAMFTSALSLKIVFAAVSFIVFLLEFVHLDPQSHMQACSCFCSSSRSHVEDRSVCFELTRVHRRVMVCVCTGLL